MAARFFPIPLISSSRSGALSKISSVFMPKLCTMACAVEAPTPRIKPLPR